MYHDLKNRPLDGSAVRPPGPSIDTSFAFAESGEASPATTKSSLSMQKVNILCKMQNLLDSLNFAFGSIFSFFFYFGG